MLLVKDGWFYEVYEFWFFYLNCKMVGVDFKCVYILMVEDIMMEEIYERVKLGDKSGLGMVIVILGSEKIVFDIFYVSEFVKMIV